MQGIYQIRNIINGKVYIGSSVDIEKRWIAHKNFLRRNEHGNIYLQRAWDKYGKNNFVFEIVENVPNKNKILEREQWYLDNWNLGYNIAKSATAPSLGRQHSDEHKSKIGKSVAGEKNGMYGKKHSLETRLRMGLNRSGENVSGENSTGAKLTTKNVLKIRSMYNTGKFTCFQLGTVFGVCKSTVARIIKRKTWKHI